VDGLVERDLRRWGGGRESSTVYELAKSAIGPTAIGAWMIYLGMPVSVDPSYVIVPFVFLFGFSVRVTTDRLKKYF
jgi:integrating conjugative element membrane protein (TIGR03747 family)